MNETFESVYPDLLKTGLDKLKSLDARRELLALFSALEYFRRDLHGQDTARGILETGHRYISALNLFRSAGFWLVNQEDFSFELTQVAPESERLALEKIVGREIKAGRFATAVRQNAPVFFATASPENPERAVFHSLALSSHVLGMFCGVLQRETVPTQEIAFSLLSLLLGESADALATLNKTRQLTRQIETLSGLLPLCAWCKKVRNDDGYWEQIERYISVRSGASITHGVCPDCRQKFLAGTPPM
jgi:hypothetical protein